MSEKASPPQYSLLIWASGAVLSAIVCVACLALLPGRSNQFVRVDVPRSEAPPQAAAFTFGPLYWDRLLYERDPSLNPLRTFFRAECGERRGVDAAVCLATRFSVLFPVEPPQHEFLDSKYDLIEDFEAHVHGAPGHCVTRSGLLAAVLLAVGTPARQLQILLTNRLGHNLVEVWDESWGWVVVDPSYLRIAVDSSGHPTSVNQVILGDASFKVIDPKFQTDFYDTLADLRAHGSIPEIVFPEPWLYMRLGKRAASWPFRGLMVHTGGVHALAGPAQLALRTLAAGLFLAAVGCGLFALRWRAKGATTRSSSMSVDAQHSPNGEMSERACNVLADS